MLTFDPYDPQVRPAEWDEILRTLAIDPTNPSHVLQSATEAAVVLPTPGSGRTRELWEALAQLAALDLTAARALEPHLDAVAILEQARDAGADVPATTSGSWGVFAAEGPGVRLEATRSGGRVQLDGRKPWCSLAGVLDHALVTAWVSNDQRQLFAVDLHSPGVRVAAEPWVARGLPRVESGPVDFKGVPATPVGAPGWYLERPGFAWGGAGVAAIWWGGAARLLDRMARQPRLDDVQAMLLGQADSAAHAAGSTLRLAAEAIDAGRLAGSDAWPAVVRVRHVVHEACEFVLRAATHSLGPAPMTGEEDFAARVADLELYLRQHKPERDLVPVGRRLQDGMEATWR